MGIFYQQQNTLFSEGSFIEIKVEVHGHGKMKTPVSAEHPLVTAAKAMDWEGMFQEIEPVLYKGKSARKHLGRKLDLRAHCGIYLLQAMHNWTDRESEDMLRHHAPTRVFCGYAEDSKKCIDHTRIEKFRNRLGSAGADLMQKHHLKQAAKCRFTNGRDVDMDTTVQEAGIAHPVEMNLMKKFRERVVAIAEKVIGAASDGMEKLKDSAKIARKLAKEYNFFARTPERKKELIEETRIISLSFLEELEKMVGLQKALELRPRMKKEMNHLLEIMPKLLEQIKTWLETGKVAKDKILSLYKDVPRFITKGKIGKATEIGRKFIINQYLGGFLLLICPKNPVIADSDCVKLSLKESVRTFGEGPDSYGADRAMHTKENIRRCKKYGIKKIGLQPRGRKEWETDQETAREMYCRRAAIEPRIGICGRLGLKESRAKTDEGDVISGLRAGIGFNLKKMLKLWSAQTI